MRYQLWALLYRMKHAEIYAQRYRNRITFWHTLTTIFLSLISAGSIAGWVIWANIPVVWSLLLAVSQVMQIMRQHLPFTSHRCALRFYIPALSKQVVELTHAWHTCDMNDHVACAEIHHQFLKQFADLDAQYFGDESIKCYKKMHKATTEECDRFFKPFGLEIEEGDANA